MNKKILVGISAIIGIALSFVACKKYPDGQGPEYFSAPSNFSVINGMLFIDSAGSKKQKVDFSSPDPHFFNAEFSHKVDWTLRITGLRSGAIKVIKGSSTKLDATNSQWRGGHSGTFFFKNNEKCVSKLSFLGSNYSVTDTFTISKVFNFNRLEDGIILLQGQQLTNPNLPFKGADFEGNFTLLPDGKINDFPQQFAFLEGLPYDNYNHPNSFNKLISLGPLGSVEGNKCYMLYHTPDTVGKSQCDKAPYFGGAMQFRFYGKRFNGQNYNFLTDWIAPDDIWVNVYLYGNDTTMNSQFAFELHEADESNEVNKTLNPATTLSYAFGGNRNSPLYCKARVTEGDQQIGAPNYKGFTTSFKHDPPSDDAYNYNFIPDTKGWKLYSHKMTSADRSKVANNGCCGNGIMETNKIARVQLGIISLGRPFRATGAIFDYAVITKGGPFNPDKY